MTLWARTDVMSVHVSGAGHEHTRPVDKAATAEARKAVKNAPAVHVRDWHINCAYCEDKLKDEPVWANHPNKVQQTPDEELANTKLEKEGNILSQLVAKAISESLASQVLTSNPEIAAKLLDDMNRAKRVGN